MTKEEKIHIAEGIGEKLSGTNFFYIIDAGGLSVAETNKFRRMCFDKGIEYVVAKNTLIKKALDGLSGDYADFGDQVLKGFSGIMLSKESSNDPAKLLKAYRKTRDKKLEPKPVLKGASIDGALFIGDSQIEVLANLKSKEELLGEILGLLMSPIQTVIGALKNKDKTDSVETASTETASTETASTETASTETASTETASTETASTETASEEIASE